MRNLMMLQKTLLILALPFMAAQSLAQALQLPDGLVHYGSNQQVWLNKLRGLARGENHKFRIVQLGDSHTAGEYFSDLVRKQLQARLGDGGIGWVFPHSVKGQRNPQVSYQGKDWTVLSSRRDTADFPLGGVVARSQGRHSLIINPTVPQLPSAMTFTLLPPRKGSSLLISDSLGQQFRIVEEKGTAKQWFYTYLKATPPISIQSSDGAVWELGAMNIENERQGVVYSALGINGAQLSEVNKWRIGWWQDLKRSRADLVILAYGTNEAYGKVDAQQMQKLWAQTIANIRKTLPQAGILIIGAPEALKDTAGQCGSRAPSLDTVQALQWQVAQQQQTLYWSWQNAMGGVCSMKGWIGKKLAAKDGVHFTQAGYETAALHLANALIELARSR